jgi:hypothetical protein
VKLFDDIGRTYSYMLEHSRNGVFTGSTVMAYRTVAGTDANYAKAFRFLSEMGCIEQLRRGRRGVDSVIRLIRVPTPTDFQAAYVKPLTPPTSTAKLQGRVEQLERRLPNVDLVTLLESFDTRLTNLEAAVDFLTPREEE